MSESCDIETCDIESSEKGESQQTSFYKVSKNFSEACQQSEYSCNPIGSE